MTVQLFFKMFLAFIMSAFTFFGTAPKQDVKMIAHRGYSGIYPENTELAFEKAAKHGSAGAETDVRVTSDGVYVVSHSGTAEFKGGTELEIASSTYAQLTEKPLKNKKTLDKVYLCTFEKYLEVMKEHDMICFIELKGSFTDAQVGEIFTLAGEVYDLSKCILQSFNYDNLLKAHAQFPDLGIMLTADNETPEEEIAGCLENGFSIDMELTAATEELIEEFHSRGLEFAVWTANDPFSLAYCKSLGVDYIESDFFG